MGSKGTSCISLRRLFCRSGSGSRLSRASPVRGCGFLLRVYWWLVLFVVHVALTSIVPPFGINPALRNELEAAIRGSTNANRKLQTSEKFWGPDADRGFWTIFIRNAILRENPALDPTEVFEWANVWYLVCSEVGEDIPLTLAMARVESAAWETMGGRHVFVGFNPHAVSPKGAIGLFQLMIPTAREVADKLGIYYNKSVRSPYDAIMSVSSDTSSSLDAKRKLIWKIILKHIERYPGSIEAVTLNPIDNIKMGIYYFAHLGPAKRGELSLEARIESYNAGFVGHLRGWRHEETVLYSEKVMSRYGVYKNEADSARLNLLADRPAPEMSLTFSAE